MCALDRALRAAIGACLTYLAFAMPWLIGIPSVNLLLGLFGLLNVLSAGTGVCPAYVLAKVSTRREERRPSKPPRETGGRTTEGVTKSLRNKLMLCIVLPGVLAVSLFGVVLHRFASDLVLEELTADARAVTLLAAGFPDSHGSVGDDPAGSGQERSAAIASSIVAGLIFHDRAGRPVPHAWRKPPDATIPTADISRAVGASLSDRRSVDTGRLTTPTSDVLWTTRRLPDGETWVTAVVETHDYDEKLATLLGPRVLSLVLIVLWLTLWGAIYNVRKYTQRMAVDAEELRQRSLHDPMTGLLNRTGLDEALQRDSCTSGTVETGTAFIALDLIGFRAISDSFGHQLADQLLRDVADRLCRAIPEGCLASRLNDDTFGVLYAGLRDADEARAPLQRLHEAIDSTYPIGDMQLALTSRSGIAFAPRDTREGNELIRFADMALSRARRTHVRHCRYDSDHDTPSVRRLTLMSALRQAIENDDLELVYQPKISLATGELSGVEALTRWTHPDYGNVPPGEFIELAERTGLIDGLTRWVLLNVERQCATWRARGLSIPIAVNLSPLNLLDPELPGLVEKLVSSGSLADGLLELELTENAVMEDADHALERLRALRELGVTLSIDDFGSGQSSFAYLQRFPISNLKIDRQFVMPVASESDGKDALLLRSMVELGHNLGFEVTAEGVETESRLQQLRALGCNYAQGYHIARPMSADALTERFAAADGSRSAAA